MVDGLLGFIAQYEWIGNKSFVAVLAAFDHATNTCLKALFIVNDEHDCFLLHQKHQQHACRTCSFVSVGNGCGNDKWVSHSGAPIYVKHVMRRSRTVARRFCWPPRDCPSTNCCGSNASGCS